MLSFGHPYMRMVGGMCVSSVHLATAHAVIAAHSHQSLSLLQAASNTFRHAGGHTCRHGQGVAKTEPWYRRAVRLARSRAGKKGAHCRDKRMKHQLAGVPNGAGTADSLRRVGEEQSRGPRANARPLGRGQDGAFCSRGGIEKSQGGQG